MRERTPSADDTPKRAPPAPSREAVVAGSETSSDDTIEAYHTAKLHGISSASGATSSADRMVASMQSLEDLAVNHPANATGSNGDRQQQQQERYGHAYRSSAQTAQDKRSRLSNVINNLRKKVPDGTAKGNAESPRKEEDDRNSVERNLETLEKYVMTVLNGVIKDDEEEDKGKSAEKMKETERRRKDAEEEENPIGTTVKSEPSNESDIEAAVVPSLEDSSLVENAESSKVMGCLIVKGVIEENVEVSEVKISQDSKELSTRTEEEHVDVEKGKSSESDRDTSREKKENQTLGTIIMDRLSEHQVEERANVDDGRGRDRRDECVVSENIEVQAICVELLDEVLNDVYLTIDNQKSQREECEKMNELIDTAESKVEEIKDSNVNSAQELKSLHCSLPLDKIAFVLQNCQTSESVTSVTSRLSSGSSSNSPSAQKSKSSSCTTPPVRLLCLYCDRKFLSISRRQRHTERVHQLGGGRRSERNFRKPSQNCQYCSEKCADTLETLLQHMISNHGDKYHACVQCLTRYPTREALMGHMNEMHGGNAERTTDQTQPEKIKEGSSCKEFCNHEMVKVSSVKERRSEEKELETNQGDSRQSDSTRSKLIVTRDSIDNPVSPEFDSSFYSNVSCNIRENLLHHLDGKLQTIGSGSPSSAPSITVSGTTTESKSQQQQQQPPQQSYYEHSVNQIQFPIDISLTAATPVYSKDYSVGEEYENSSEYARKAGKTSSSSRPRRVSFEKYNFPRKYDGKEQWTCSIEDLSKFDISTQLSLRKKQQLIKERLTINRLHQIPLLSCETTEVSLRDQKQVESIVETTASSQNNNVDESYNIDAISAALDVVRCDPGEPPPSEIKETTTTEELSSLSSSCLTKSLSTTEFTIEFIDFMRLKRREPSSNETVNVEETRYAELSGEWSRTRIYICGACGSKHMTLKEMEDHKASTHPRVLCSHFELTGDQREHYKHLYLPGRSAPTDEARDAMLAETACTKCTKTCLNVAELHRHMLECGGDHAWLLGLTGSGKRKCKWRPFGSRSRRRRQRGMKRNIQNSQTQPRIVNTERPKEKQAPAGPRIRPSDRESIQKMLANLPAKRATRKVLQDNVMRSQSKLRNVQTRTRPRIIGDNSSVSRISRNKAALRNKLLKNAKSIQRNRCRSDNITAVIESVVKKCHETEKRLDDDGNRNTETENENKKDAKEINEVSLASKVSDTGDKTVRSKVIGRPKIFGRKGNIKTKTGNNSQFQGKAGDKLVNLKVRRKSVKFKSNAILKSDAKGEETSSPKNIPKNSKMTPRTVDKDNISPDSNKISTAPGIRSKLTQSTLKRKRSVDPVASLNASLKAKLQLRTQDGKFARNPNKDSSTKSEMKMDDGKHKAANSVEMKLPKSKTIQKLKKAEVQLPRRTTRLSSDSDKMPTLEPVVQIVSSSEEYTDKSTNDLPILSPVTSSGSLQDQKSPRTSAKYVLKEKEGNIDANADCEVIPKKSTKEQKSTRERKPKQESKDTMKRKETEIVEEDEISKNNSMMLKEKKTKNKKNLYIKNNIGENNREETSKGEIIAKKDLKPKKEETTKKTRSNSRTRLEKNLMKLPDLPFEVQRLLKLPSSFPLYILSTLELESNDTGSKRDLRPLKKYHMSDKELQDFYKDIDDVHNALWKNSKRARKREKIETIRKSSRKNVDKKTDDKMTKTINLEKDSVNNTVTKDTTNNVEKSQPSKKDNHANTKIKEIDNSDIEDKIDSRQTRRSLIDAKNEPPEVAGGSSQKGSGLFGKRRSRNKLIDDPEETNAGAVQKQNNNENVMPKETQKEVELEEAVDKNEIEDDDNSNPDDRDSTMVNLNLSHLQSETSNLSVDSGKENSLETSVNIHNKLKVTRPKKTWGTRREKSSRKRSLNNVIGILTEGINIPVEQSVQVLTVQTSLDNPDRIARNGSTQQSVGSENNMIAVDSSFSELSVLPRSEQESAENEIIATNANDNHCADNEKNAHPCIDKVQDENNFTNQVDISSKVSTAKMHSPANDIILDLSRRKPKGKGSFLEKIVSKIAKQKDALLEGEVGSLLDNAADELTSILDEVGPALVDNAESANFGEVSYTSKNEYDESITSTSTDEKLSVIATSEIQLLEEDITKSATSNHSTDLSEIQDNLEGNLATKIEMQAQSKSQTKINDVSDVEIKDNYIVDKQASDTMRSVEELQVEFCENKSVTNEEAIIPMEIPDETPSSLTDTLTEISISSIATQKLNEEKLEKKASSIKSRRKSSKRSLEDASWPKKSKRKSLEVEEELAEKENETIKISKTDAEVEKLQCSESKIIKDLELSSSLEKVPESESNLEKSANLPEAAYEEANELTASFKEAVDKIISDGGSNVQSIELIQEDIESSTLFLKKTVERGKFTDKTRKKNQIDDLNPSEFSHRRTSKRKSQFLSDVLQPSMKPVNEEKKLLSLSSKRDSLEFTDEKLMKVGIINENSDASLEETMYSMQIISEKCEKIQNTDDSSLGNSTSPKTTKKHGTKEKSLADEHLDLSNEPGKITSKFNKEINVPDSNEQLSADLDHFKIPEVKDLLQSGKKRGPKKKLLPEDDRYNGESVSEESRINEELAEVSEISNLIEKVEEQVECKKHIVREQRSSRKKLERSNSSSSIGFIPSLVKTRSMLKKKMQLSSEDLIASNIRNQDAESTDDLSESSCASESSYFRKKRFAKRKRKEENIVGDNDEQTDSIIAKCNKGNSKKPQSGKSLLDEHLDLSDMDDIDIPMDIQASLENTKALENIEREFELAEKSLGLQNEDADDKPTADESANKDITTEQSVSNSYDSPDDPVTPKKRAAGNFVVVHTKTGEILIVEKKKKLTKEAARFFCDVCTTSFTRKSSLKKHTLSQSHLSQMAKSTKDKLELVNNGTSENSKEIDDKEKNNRMSDTKNVLDDGQSHEVTQDLESNENYVPYRTSTESLVSIGVTRQEALEDKLLDEEICKITENMSHDEYVLTDQVTPEDPISSSTPIKQIQTKQEESGRSKKRNKSKKKNLAEEHLILESPELKGSKLDSNEPLNSVNDLEWSSSSSSCEHSSTKEMIQTVKEAKDVPEEIQHADLAEIKNQAESIVKTLNDEINCSKLSCDTDVRDEHHIESTRTRSRTNVGLTRELLALQSTAYPVDDLENDSIHDKKTSTRKFYKIDNDRKEENQTSTEITRFSLRPRRNKNIQHYEESDVEADIYFTDASMEINNGEIENSYDSQKKPNETEEEMIENVLQEMAYTDTKNKITEVAKSKPDSTNDSKKRKRGRPRLKDRIIPNSSVISTHSEFEINENDIATSSFEESKNKDQKLISHTKEHFNEARKTPCIDANIQPSKRRGRPRKNPIVANNLLIQAEDSSISESMKSKCNEIRENTEQIESETLLIEKAISITLADSLTSNVESLPAVEDHIRESNLSETKKDELKVEENEILFTKMNSYENQSVQEIESTNIKIAVLAQNCDMLAFNVPSEKNKAANTSMLSEMKICADDEKYLSESKSDNNDTSANVLINSTVESLAEFSPEIVENVSTTNDDLQSVKSIRTIELDENLGIQKSNISEEKQIESREELPEIEVFQKETDLVSESEGNEDEVIDDKSLSITNVGLTRELLVLQSTAYPTDDLENDSIRDKKTTRLESSSKRLSRSFQSADKERETGRRKSKVSRGRRKKVTAAKIAEISSDSENEVDRIESASSNKSKIVKSVFGRVFGGEKADKVKEVLNDWVSRSEDDSDISRSTSEARSCLRGSTKISENGHKKDKKRHSGILTDPDTKKDAELSLRKNGDDKGNIIEVHGKLKNRKKREKDFNSMPQDRIESLSPINTTKRRHRESKIRADERIFRTFDYESLILSEGDENVNEIKETSNQFDDDYMSNKNDKSKRYYEEEWNEERMKDRNSISVDCENLRVDHNTCEKSKNSSSYRKKQDINARNERSSSPSQFNMFKCRRRESKIKAGEKIWYTLDNETSSCLSDDQDLNETHKNFKEREGGFHEFRDADRSNNSKNVKHKDNDTWKNISLINQEQIEAQNARGKSRKDSNNHKKQNFNNTIGIDKTKTDNMISKNSDNDLLITLKNQKPKNEMQNDQATLSVNESMNRSKNLIVKDNTCEFFADMNRQLTNSRKSKKGNVNEDWKYSMKSLEFEKEDLAKDNQPIEKEIRQKHEISATLSRSCSNLTGLTMKDQFAELDENSQAIQESDNDDNNDEEEEQEDDDDEDDNDLGHRRMSPFYACETPDSSIESSSNNEEDEEEDGEEDEEERMTHEDTSRKTNPSEFSGEKIVIRSPSSGHRSDVVTIAPTDAIEDNALDVPREIESTTEPRQGKILNFDEELFVECCSRLKATSENELRGAKKIKLDHTESYHRRDDQPQGFKVNKDRWRDVESQNSLGSLLESVNQLLGEEMCNSHDRSYRTRGSEQSSRSASPDASRVDNLGYEDSLDVAFEHNNKLRDKIQQRMRESENLIASTFGQKINDNDHPGDDKRCSIGNSYSSSIHEHEQSTSIASNGEHVPPQGHKNKVNSTLGGLLDKALSNLLHSNSKHDHNGSAPMKLLAELACARAPTSTSPEDITSNGKNHQSVKMVAVAVAAAAAAAATATKDTSDLSKKPTKGSTITSKTSLTKKTRNPIKELFERKKEINDRKEQERSRTTLVESNMQKPRKPKRSKKQQQEFPLIRRNELYGGMMEKKKRRDSFDRKGESERIKDVYEFDEEESQTAPTLGSVMSYRSQVDKSYETNWPKKDIVGKLSTVSENGKTNSIADTKLGVIIDHKFQELEKFAPKTKGALKSFQSEEQQQQQVTDSITGPMDDFVERKRLKRLEQSVKQSNKLKKRGKSSKKRARNAWYENDSSDEFRTAAKAEDVGVGISKSQRACSKGKQNLFAELSTSSESEYEREDDVDYVLTKEQQSLSKSRKSLKKQLDIDKINCDQRIVNESKFDNENLANCEWQNQVVQKNVTKKDYNTAKSESEMSDRSLVIDERKATDETRNSDDDADNQYERTFELEDLYREDSSEVETEIEGNEELIPTPEEAKDRIETQALDDENATLQTKVIPTSMKDDYAPENELISLEEALDLLDRHENLESKSENDSKRSKIQTENDSVNGTLDTMNEVSNDGIINMEKENEHLNHVEAQDEKEEPDDDVPALPEKLSSNEKPQKESDNNLPLHVFLSRKVQESKKRKQQQLDKLREEQERILMDFQPTRRQRKCAIGKQGLLAEISSSDEESYARDNNKKGNDHDKSRKKRESKEKKKERYLEKKHEQMIAKEQKAIEEEILREVGKRKEILSQSTDVDTALNIDVMETKIVSGQVHKKKHQPKEKQKKSGDENIEKSMQHTINQSPLDSSEDIRNNLHAFCSTENIIDNNGHLSISSKRKKLSKSPTRLKKISKSGENGKISPNKKNKESTAEKSKKTSAINNKDSKERRSSGGKHDSDDEELKTTKSWNKVEEGVGVAIGRRKRTAAHQLYYWSSSSDEEEAPELVLMPEEEEDDRQEQHGWIVGDSHKRMITMLAMEKQQKEKRRRSEDEFESGKSKSKKHRNSTS